MTNEAAAISPVEVTQEDRVAAEGHHGQLCNAFGPTPLCCSCGIEEAFARHRLNTTRSPVLSDEQRGLVERLRLIAAWRKRGGPTPKEPKPSVFKATTEAADLIEALSRSDTQT